MENKPFKCPQCLNWFTPVPMPEDMMCATCADGKHAVNKVGLIDCHWGHVSATPSEIRMAVLWNTAKTVAEKDGLGGAKSESAVTAILADMERDVALLERGMADIPEIIRWSSVKEMPGMKDAFGSRRFKTLEALEELVEEKRRPQTDVDEVRRSMKTCSLLADEIPEMVAAARMALGQMRRDVEAWQPTEKNKGGRPKRDAVTV